VPYSRENFDSIRRLQTETESECVRLVDKLEYTRGFTIKIGSWHKAAAIKRELLEKRQQILNDKHPNTIAAISNLAMILHSQSKFKEAAAIRKGALEKR
jgi:hypothetical protein